MCGRYSVVMEEDIIEMRAIIQEINERYNDSALHAQMKIGEIFPTNVAPILAWKDERIAAGLMRWGFPKWEGTGVVITARAETAHKKLMFTKALETRRCVIPSTGFYEWSHPAAGPKEKYLIRHADTPMLYMAGLYSRYKDEQGQSYTAYVILTAPANHSIAVLHDRMPVILDDKTKQELWLKYYSVAMEILRASNDEDFCLKAV